MRKNDRHFPPWQLLGNDQPARVPACHFRQFTLLPTRMHSQTRVTANTTVFPSDESVRRFLRAQGQEEVWVSILPDEGATYDEIDEIDTRKI